MGLASDFITQTKQLVMSAVASNFTTVASSIKPLFLACFLLYCVVIAWMILYSNREMIIGEVIKNIIVFSLIGAFVWTAGYYQQSVVPFVMDSGAEISAKLTGSENVALSIDETWDKLSNAMEEFKTRSIDTLGWDIGPLISTYFIYAIGYAGGAILVVYTTLFLCVATFMTGILLSVGSIFICFAGFPATRSMFTAWCGHCLNYIMLNVFYTISFTFVLKLIEKYTALDPSTVSFMDAITLLLVVIICIGMVEQVAVLCSSLTGGVGINGLVPGVGSVAKAAGINKAASTMRDKAAVGVGGGIKKGASALANKFKNNIKGG